MNGPAPEVNLPAIPNRSRGDLLKLPATSISHAVRQAMEQTTDKATGAKLANVSRNVYDFVRKLLLLSEDDRLTPDHRVVLRGALRMVDKEKRTKTAEVIAGGIVNEYWARKTMTGVTEQQKTSHRKRKKIFESVLFHIREACANNDEVEIPALRQEERTQAVDTLIKSIENLSAMARKINRKESETSHVKDSGIQDSGHSGEEPVGGVGKITTAVQ